jgi:hypothetical protein
MKLARHWFWILTLAGSAPLGAWAQGTVVERPPFIQRVVLTDFLLLETNNDTALAPTNVLVIYFPSYEQPSRIERAVALRRGANGKCVVTYLTAVPPKEPGQFRREEKEIDPAIARNVMAVFRHLLETNVYAPIEALYQPSKNDDAWILLRDRQVALAGVVLNGSLHAARTEDVRVYRDLCAGLIGMFLAPPDERDKALVQLDRFAATYVESKQLLRR